MRTMHVRKAHFTFINYLDKTLGMGLARALHSWRSHDMNDSAAPVLKSSRGLNSRSAWLLLRSLEWWLEMPASPALLLSRLALR